MNNSGDLPASPGDAWQDLRRYTPARIALGRSGGSQLTRSVLEFRAAHALARDAVHAVFDANALRADFGAASIATETLATHVRERREYLLRPDRAQVLDEPSREQLARHTAGQTTPLDLAIVVSDGLSATAAHRHAVATIVPLLASLRTAGWTFSPVYVVPFARVKLQDEIGAAVRARFALMLLGERPGLGTPDSLGAYFTAQPGPHRSDADRNCVSNIRQGGLPPAAAAAKLEWLLRESARTGLHGVQLKDEQPAVVVPRQART